MSARKRHVRRTSFASHEQPTKSALSESLEVNLITNNH